MHVRVCSLAYKYNMCAHAPLLQQSGRPAKRGVSIALPKAGRVHRQVSSACRTSILSSTQYVHASSLTTWENACDCKRARVQPGYADADVRCACADETFAANLICSFSVKWSGARAVSIAPLVMSCTRVYSTELDSIHMAGMCM